jgi:hypothetical protein
VLHHRLIVATLFCNLFFGIAHGDDHSASGLVIAAGASPSAPISPAHRDFSCAASGEAADDVMTVQTTLAGVPAILRMPRRSGNHPLFFGMALVRPLAKAS